MEIIWHPSNDNAEASYFEVVDDYITIDFEYYHQSCNLWDNNNNNFVIILLDSPCNNAESNVFEVYIDNIDERCGYMLPINAIISRDNHPKGGNIHNYLHASFEFLLNRITRLYSDKNMLSDYYHDNLVVCILHKETINKIKDFSLDNYTLSLFEKGYYYYSKYPFKKVEGYDYDKFISVNNRIKIKSSISPNNNFLKDLFCIYIPNEEAAIARFILAYQAIEYYMAEMCDIKIQEIISDYKDGKLSKNDYFERVKDIGGERQQIHYIFEGIKREHPSVNNFKDDCLSLFAAINYDRKKVDVPDLFYDFRNLLVHDYRKIMSNKELVCQAIQSFELLVVYICNNIDILNTRLRIKQMIPK